MMMLENIRDGEAEVGTRVGREGIGGIHTQMSGHIEGTDPGMDRSARPGTPLETGVRIGEIGRGIMGG